MLTKENTKLGGSIIMFNKNFVKTLLITSTLVGIPAMAAPGNLGSGVEKTQLKVGSSCAAHREFNKQGSFGKKLGLTDDQLTKIASLKDQGRVTTAPQKAQLRGLNDQLKDVLTKPELDKQQALSIESKINDLRAQLANERLEQRIDFMSILTPQQKDTLRHKMLVSEAFGGSGGHHMRHHFGGRA
jgi:Spy/CpxP family protein refolding chaperone